MKTVALLFFGALCACLYACNPSSSDTSSRNEVVQEYTEVLSEDSIPTEVPLPVGDDRFEKLVTFIQTKGFSIYQNKGHQYNFYDSDGTRHGLLAYASSPEGTIDAINVYAYKRNIEDLDHFVSYKITAGNVEPFMRTIDGEWKDREVAVRGYKEFVQKVGK